MLELLATLGVALIAVGVGLRLVFGQISLAAGLTALLLAPTCTGRCGVSAWNFMPPRTAGPRPIKPSRSSNRRRGAGPDGESAARRARRFESRTSASTAATAPHHGISTWCSNRRRSRY
ncbi:cysteine/glutathione ABC superfamily ATP binding cassette transporter, ABC domain protein [Mycobacterium xenopi 4042]|uniref:Cysteine/glutathione ABC superfamily ATP binding cassette transporter, ABC domain protein n=1 Tax=Mycobacterium xenopi 4042 TaxID=1299334 RepID=X7YPL0_MYCXE|nr:cysteine/glutathione ABC superfamily ATP binding cassette transporter, ABC domain protein [Mycobacterium xenopi 4042]